MLVLRIMSSFNKDCLSLCKKKQVTDTGGSKAVCVCGVKFAENGDSECY